MAERVRNAAGRWVPTKVNGVGQVPYNGPRGFQVSGSRAAPPIRSANDYPLDGDKRVADLREAIRHCGLRNGMTVSSHHSFRDGDLVMVPFFRAAAEMGLRDLVWFPSAAFPCHEPLIELLEAGVINRIEGSLNGPLGRHASAGKMAGQVVLRSHGGRAQAVRDGEVHIDLAVIAAPTCDPFGNATGDQGPSACGSLAYSVVDSMYADRVVMVTDNLVPFPCLPSQIQGNYVDCVVEFDRIGVPEKIVSGTTHVTTDPQRLRIAELTARFIRATEGYHDGFAFQAGAGGTSLAMAQFLARFMREDSVRARFMRGGGTATLVAMLESGQADYLLDDQAFDLEAVRSMRENPRHVATSAFTTYNHHTKGNFTTLLDFAVLGATEVDTDFNANVVSHSDGLIAHGIGGWQNCLFARTAILMVPSARRGHSVIRDRVATLCGPADLIDVVVTERGVAVNPRREDLTDQAHRAGLPLRSLEELKDEVERETGTSDPDAELDGDIVGVVKWVDGTVIDSLYRVTD